MGMVGFANRRRDARPRAPAARSVEIVFVCLGNLAFAAAAILANGSASWESARQALLTSTAAESIVGTKLERILHRLARGSTEVVFRRVTPAAAPSSTIVDAAALESAPLVLSIHVDDEALDDPATGIRANPIARGREWERVAYASFFRSGELVHASRVGLRRHGDTARQRETLCSARSM